MSSPDYRLRNLLLLRNERERIMSKPDYKFRHATAPSFTGCGEAVGVVLVDEKRGFTGIYYKDKQGKLWPCRTVMRSNKARHDEIIAAWLQNRPEMTHEDRRQTRLFQFLRGGTVTWTSRSGVTERREVIAPLAILELKATDWPNDPKHCYELWDGNWSIVMDKTVVSSTIRGSFFEKKKK
jgi:hypothetical protein